MKKNLDLLKKVIIGLLSVCAIESFATSLASNYKESIKCVF